MLAVCAVYSMQTAAKSTCIILSFLWENLYMRDDDAAAVYVDALKFDYFTTSADNLCCVEAVEVHTANATNLEMIEV